VADWLGVSVVLAFTPVARYSDPVTPTLEMMTLALPLFVSVTLAEPVELTSTVPKLKLLGLTSSNWLAVVAVPLRGIVMGELGALLDTEIEPVSVPAAVGLNVAVKVALPPAAIVDEGDILEALKPVPVADIADTVTLEVPVFFRVIVCELVLPVATLPNATLVGVADSAPCAPVPVKLTATLGSEASLVTVILPLELAVEVGLNCAVNDVLCPALSVSGVDNPV
jgi:hypothetical protein